MGLIAFLVLSIVCLARASTYAKAIEAVPMEVPISLTEGDRVESELELPKPGLYEVSISCDTGAGDDIQKAISTDLHVVTDVWLQNQQVAHGTWPPATSYHVGPGSVAPILCEFHALPKQRYRVVLLVEKSNKTLEATKAELLVHLESSALEVMDGQSEYWVALGVGFAIAAIPFIWMLVKAAWVGRG